MALVQEYLRCRGSISVNAFARSKGIGRTTLYNWLFTYTSTSEEFKFPLQENLDTMKDEIQDLAQLQAELARLQQKCRNLEDDLKISNLKNEVLEALIYVTEQQLGYSLKKAETQAIKRPASDREWKVEQACKVLGISRQAYSQSRSRSEQRQVSERELVRAIMDIRSCDPRIGAVKLWLILKHTFEGNLYRRDRLIDLMHRYA